MKKKVFQEVQPSLRVASRKHEQTTTDTRMVNCQLLVPQYLQLICKLVKISPEKILKDFMGVLGQQSLSSPRGEKPYLLLIDYFTAMTYGETNYSDADIRSMFSELKAIDDLWPHGADEKFVSSHCNWREEYLKYWLEKWQGKAF